MATWLRDTEPFSNLFVGNMKIGDNINPPKAFYKVLSSAPPKQYKISEMCWTLESQLCLGGRGSRYYWRVNKILTYVLATIVVVNLLLF